MYFECNLPKESPKWLDKRIKGDFQEMLDRVRKRMEKLEEAMVLSTIASENFAKCAKVLFNSSAEKFDEMCVSEIADITKILDTGEYIEPRMNWVNAEVIIDTRFITTPEWEMIRNLGIGGSDAQTVLGVSPYKVASELYHEKVGTPCEKETSWVFDRGHALEEKVIEAFCNLTGAKVVEETRMFRSKEFEHCFANIDAIVRMGNGNLYVFEAKTTIRENHKAWENGKIPAGYVSQTRQYPAILNDERIKGTYIGCLFTDDIVIGEKYITSRYNEEEFVCRFVARDTESERELLESENYFFNTYVKQNLEPEKIGEPEKEIECIRKYQGKADKDSEIEKLRILEFANEIAEYNRLGEEKQKLEKKLKEIKDTQKSVSIPLIERLGTSIEMRVPISDKEYWEIKNSPRSRTNVDVASLKIAIDSVSNMLPNEQVEALKNCISEVTESTRVFSIKKKKDWQRKK